MKHLGDITKIAGHRVPPVDVVIGGSPCQDLSTAGKRAGLAGTRSGLFMEQIRLIKEMRMFYGRPRYMVWENVPGAFSSNKGDDFRAVLEETIRIVEPDAPDIPLPKKRKWPLSDCWYGDGWSVAYRVFDAQFWGTPQRRRRIALIADFGGLTAPEILFERDGLCRNPPSIEAEGETPAAEVGGGSGAPSVYCLATQQGGAELRSDDKAPTLTAAAGMSGNNQPVVCLTPWGRATLDTQRAGGIEFEKEKAPTLSEGQHDASVVMTVENHPDDSSRVKMKNCYSQAAYDKYLNDDKAATIKSSGGSYGGGSENLVVEELDGYNATLTGDKSSTLGVNCGMSTGRNGVLVHDVAENTVCAFHGQASYTADISASSEVAPNLMNTKQVNVQQKYVVRRLTPLECERLQVFPDGWTDIGPWVDSKGRLHKDSSDAARYKALGNSIAIPPWAWVLRRLSAQFEYTPTMASLFDGIGGFPLIWERLNGAGSCLWSSEIEEFPIAVTRFHFGESSTGGGSKCGMTER